MARLRFPPPEPPGDTLTRAFLGRLPPPVAAAIRLGEPTTIIVTFRRIPASAVHRRSFSYLAVRVVFGERTYPLGQVSHKAAMMRLRVACRTLQRGGAVLNLGSGVSEAWGEGVP